MEFIFLAIGFFLGANYTAHVIRKQIHHMAKQQGFVIEEQPTTNSEVLTLSVEKHGNMYYLFDVKTNNFVCQAPTIEELGKILFERKNVNLALVQNNNENFWFVKGNISQDSK